LDEIYLLLNISFVIFGFRGLKVIYGGILGGLLALIYSFVTDPEVMMGLLMVTGGTLWLVIVLMGTLLGGLSTFMGVVLRRVFKFVA
jgi:hypothetical protein